MSTKHRELIDQEFSTNSFGRTHGWIDAENDARIYVRIQGEGTPLLAMGGIGSGAFTTAKIAKLLAERYKIISYDRRGTFRSIIHRRQEFDIAQQCRDVQLILDTYGLTSVTVLTTCSSASIAMELLTNYPELVNAMIIHDPMNVAVLPDAEVEASNFRKYWQICTGQSAEEAMAAFLLDFELPFPDDFRRAIKRQGENEGDQFLLELMPCVTYQPDIEKLRKHRNRLVIVTGQQCKDRGYSFSRAALALSEQIGCQFDVVPGNHTGYYQDPDIFAQAIFDMVEKLTQT